MLKLKHLQEVLNIISKYMSDDDFISNDYDFCYFSLSKPVSDEDKARLNELDIRNGDPLSKDHSLDCWYLLGF